MITITNLSKNFTEKALFKDVSLSIFPNEKIGLTGPNGSGKTTLFHIILNQSEPSGGSVQTQRNLRIGYLPQEAHFSSDRTVLEELTSGDDRIKKILDEKRVLEEKGRADSPRYGDVLHELEQLGIYELEHRAEKILMGLGFKTEDFHRPIVHLSGGWQMRTLLAKLLTYPYDILLLDEPTNFLDLPATLWLKDFLANYQGTFVMISHDKVFLNSVTNYTIILDYGQMMKVKGNYEAFEQQMAIEFRSLEKKQKVIEQKRQQLERFTQRFHAQPNRASAVRNKRKMIERLEQIELPQARKSIADFEFPQTPSSGYVVENLEKINKAYGVNQIYKDFDFEIVRNQKICLVGPNGAGKSTLLKILAGVLAPDTGVVKLGHQVQRGYFSQTRLDVLNPDRSVLDELASAVQGTYPALQMRSLLGIFNFHGEDVFKMVKVLSGGEKSRLILAKLLINPPNFILLDEPTTHLDIDGVGALTKAFKAYQGTLVFISHDLYFIKEVANYIVEVSPGEVKAYPGGLDYYLEKKNQARIVDARQLSLQEKQSQKSPHQRPKGSSNPKLLEIEKKHKEAQNRMQEIKNDIKQLEKEMRDLETETYVKARILTNSFGKDPNLLKECGQRLKGIPKRQREIASTIKERQEEFKRLSN